MLRSCTNSIINASFVSQSLENVYGNFSVALLILLEMEIYVVKTQMEIIFLMSSWIAIIRPVKGYVIIWQFT